MKEIYSWVPWFRELARKIGERDETYLIKKANQVEWEGDLSLFQHGDKGIDPFSFFYFLASNSTRNQQELVYNSVSREFEIKIPLPDMRIEDYYLFPTSGYNIFFHDGTNSGYNIFFHDGTNFYPDLLWRLFREAVKDDPKIDPDDFKKALDIKEVGVAKLTQTLFLINPKYFLPIDGSTGVLSEAMDLPALSEIEQEIQDGGYEKYESLLKKLKEAFPGCQPYEINMFLYLQKAKKIRDSKSKFFHIGTMVYGDKEDDYWDDFKKNNWVYTGGPGSEKYWGEEGKYPLAEPARGDIILVRTGRQRGRAIGIVQRNDYDESGLNVNSRIHVLWINKSEEQLSGLTDMRGFNEAGPGTCSAFKKIESYKPSFDLIERLTGNSITNGPEPDIDDPPPETDTMEHLHPLNQILYGPPGTGKTYNTINYAVAIIEDKPLDELEGEGRKEVKQRFDKLKEEGQIAMVTFHQNFTYEDFIEGIRPFLMDDNENTDDNENIEYELSKGVFRKIADRADENRRQSEQTGDESWNMDELLQAFAVSIQEKRDSGKKINLFSSDDRSGATIEKISWSREGNFRSVQLGGSVTSGHTLNADKIKEEYEAFYKGKTTSPEDIKGRTGRRHGLATYYFPLLKKIKQFHDKEWQPEEPVTVEKQNYVLIIDEINRGNIAKIFGELITLIESSKRLGQKDEAKVTLPYSKKEFGVPDNLYIIGTMNTADRSIALLDTALRRRFDFVEMMPDLKHDRISTDIEGVNCQELLSIMNKRIRFLLDREHQIGHTYFLDVKKIKGKDSLEATFKNKIIPLLQEYFYDNWEKIDLVLNCNGFIDKTSIDSNLFKNSELIDEERKIYELLPDNHRKWQDPKSYQAIYKEQGETE